MSDGFTALYIGAHDVDLGTAVVTAHGLRIIAACSRVVILGRTLFAHGVFFHRGAFAVIGHRLQYSQTRTALGTVYKGMQISSVRFIEQFCTTFRAGGDIGGNEYISHLLFALDYLKARKFGIFNIGDFYLKNHGAFGRIMSYPVGKGCKRSFFTCGIDIHI